MMAVENRRKLRLHMSPHVCLRYHTGYHCPSPFSLLASESYLNSADHHSLASCLLQACVFCLTVSLLFPSHSRLIHTFLFSACCPERALLLLARHPTVVPTQCWWISNLEVHFHSCRHYKIPLGACPASAQNRLHLLGKWAPVSTTQLPSSPPCVPYW